MNTYVVTGGTGFLGQHLVRKLLKQGAEVRVVSRSVDRALERAGATFHKGSVLNPQQLRPAMEGADGLYHLAGKVERDPQRAHTLFTLHVTGTRNALEIAAQCGLKRAVVASTSGTVGVTRQGRTIPDDSAEHAADIVKDWPYYLSKLYAEKTALSLAARSPLDIILMRPTLLLGPGDHRLSSTRDVLNFLDGNIPMVPSGGLSFVDVRDAAAAFIAAMERGQPGASYLLGGANLTFEAFFERLESISGVSRPRVAIPDPAARVGARFLDVAMKIMGRTPDIDPVSVEMSQHFWYIDWSAAMRDLDFQPRDPGLTLYDTVQWLKANRPRPDHPDEPHPEPAASPFSPAHDWQGDFRHAAFGAPATDAYGDPHAPSDPHEASTSIPFPGQSRLSYDTYGDGDGLESLVSGALKGVVGTLIGAATRQPAPRQPANRHAPRTADSATPRREASSTNADSRGELDALLSQATDEEMETILRLVRRMKQ